MAERRLEAIRADVAAGRSKPGQLVAAFELLFERPALFSWRRWGPALDVVLRRLDRYWPADRVEPPGPRRRGAGARCALEYLERRAHPDPVEWWAFERRPAPASFVLVLLELDELSRAWRRAEKLRTDPAYRERSRAASAWEARRRRRRQRVKPRPGGR